MKLTKEQVELGALYFAVSNTGLIGITVDEPKSESDIKRNYEVIDYEYANETGEGLREELQMWTEILQNGSKSYTRVLKEKVSFIFEES